MIRLHRIAASREMDNMSTITGTLTFETSPKSFQQSLQETRLERIMLVL